VLVTPFDVITCEMTTKLMSFKQDKEVAMKEATADN
jgi:hypothetical protein